jgi:ankyrin repeat protein
MCRLLISGGADVNLTIVASETALLSAVTMENLDICQLFLTSGTTILAAILGFTIRSRKVQNVTRGLQCEHQRQRRPLRHCSSSGRQVAKPGACAALLDHSANLNIIGREFGTALHEAVVCGRVDLCSMLIDAIADVNAVSNGDTALYLATKNKHNKLVKLLLEKGANPAAVGVDGRTVLLLAAANGQESWVKLLLNKYGNINKNTSNSTESSSGERSGRCRWKDRTSPSSGEGAQSSGESSAGEWC